MKDFKYIIKRILIGVGIILVLNFITGCKMVHAYETIYTNGGNCTPYNTPGIVDPNGSGWGSNYCFMPNTNTWVLSGDHAWYGENLNGNIYTVIADYYIGIETRAGVSTPSLYYNSARMSMTANNLRCGVGDYRTGYDSTYSPTISNFSVTYSAGINPNNTSTRDVYHITFKYSQRLGTNITGNRNLSCWFNIPSNSLLTQLYGNTVDNLLFTNVKDFRYSISDSADTGLLQTITSQNQTMINNQNTMINQNNQLIQNQQQTNTNIQNNTNAINNQTETIKDTNISGANTEVQNLLNSIDATDNTGLTGVITAPLSIINNLSQGCSPINLTIPYIDANVSIPCMSTDVYPKMASGGLITTISVIINGFLIYRVIASLYAMVKNFKNPDEDKVEVVDL